MTNEKIIDHLFRHHYGKMVSILTRIFGLHHLETIEDAVQDTFAKATIAWRKKIPEQPEAWLTQASKNRVIDLLRKIKSEHKRFDKLTIGTSSIAINNLFKEDQIEDSSLRMIFTACHPVLDPKDQIAFALKTISGFSMNEISTALLLKHETVKKRIARARKRIRASNLKFEFPNSSELIARLDQVHQIIYLIFNEGFHSAHQTQLIRQDLCGEAIRLCKMILKRKELRNGAGYALFALMCFHASRLKSKISDNNESIDLRSQDRSLWYQPLIELGKNAMMKTMEYNDASTYIIEAAIAKEHIIAPSFDETNWNKILMLYDQLQYMESNELNKLSIAVIHLQLDNLKKAQSILNTIDTKQLEQRMYLFYGVQAELYKKRGELAKAVNYLGKAEALVFNEVEKRYLIKKKNIIEQSLAN